MKPYKKRLISRFFLERVKKELKNQNPRTISPFWLSILSKEELHQIIKWLYNQTAKKDSDPYTQNKEELLSLIVSDYNILNYLLSCMDSELVSYNHPTLESLSQILYRLDATDHYLQNKPISLWDNYDLNNYKSLYRKAGLEQPIYGVYDKEMPSAEKYTTAPLELLLSPVELTQELKPNKTLLIL
jgi:hypothetical protein